MIYKNYELILNEDQLINLIKHLRNKKTFFFEAITDNLYSMSANLIGLSFATKFGLTSYVPMSFSCLKNSKQLTREISIRLLKPVIEDVKIFKLGKNLKYSYKILKRENIELRGIKFDVTLESYVFNSTRKHDICSISEYWLKNKKKSFENFININKKQLKINQIDFELFEKYISESADIVLKLHNIIWFKLSKNQKLLNIFQNIEIPLIPVLARIEHNGVRIDKIVLEKQSEKIERKLHELKQKAYEIVGRIFNLSSTKELQKIFYKEIKLKYPEVTKINKLSTSEFVLKKFLLNCPLSKVILEYRKLSKLKSCYIDKLLSMINLQTNRIHTSYHQSVTLTGRLSSSNPNLQNIPINNENGINIRQAFIAPENFIIVSADYSQIELRIMAHLSNDKELISTFNKGEDIHCITAEKIFNSSSKFITEEQRRSAKKVNFSIIYGISVFGLSNQLNINYKKSKEYINLYFEHYPGVLNYIKHMQIQAKEKGYVETLYGRRIYLPDIKSDNVIRRTSAERTAINAPIQGTVADIIKLAMINIDSWLEEKRLCTKMIMQVHDELIFEVYKKDFQIVSKKIQEIMENIIKLNVPILVKISNGKNWSQVY